MLGFAVLVPGCAGLSTDGVPETGDKPVVATCQQLVCWHASWGVSWQPALAGTAVLERGASTLCESTLLAARTPSSPAAGALWPTSLRPAPAGPKQLLWVGAGFLSCRGASSLSASRAQSSPGAAFAPLACRDQAVCPGIPGEGTPELLTGRPLLAASNPQGGGQGRMGCAEPERSSSASWLFSILTTVLAHQLLWEMLCHRACERLCV